MQLVNLFREEFSLVGLMYETIQVTVYDLTTVRGSEEHTESQKHIPSETMKILRTTGR
jgi:hypothetical protein